jgi:hypothetical protein
LAAAFVIDTVHAAREATASTALIESRCLFALTEENNFDEWRSEEVFPPRVIIAFHHHEDSRLLSGRKVRRVCN